MESGERRHHRGKSLKFHSSSPIHLPVRAERALSGKLRLLNTFSKRVVVSSSPRIDAQERNLLETRNLDHSLNNLRFNVLKRDGVTVDSRLPVSNPRTLHRRPPHLPHAASVLLASDKELDKELVPNDALAHKATRLDHTQEQALNRPDSVLKGHLSEEEDIECHDSRNTRSPDYRAQHRPKTTRPSQKKMRMSFNFESIKSIRDHLMAICIKYAARRVGHHNSNDSCTFSKAVARQQNQVSSKNLQISSDRILELSFKDKQSSIEVQQFIDSCDDTSLQVVSDLLLCHMDRLLQDPYGSYVGQHLMKCHKPTLERITNHISQNLLQMATNEYSSRVIQSIFDIKQEFCMRLLPTLIQMFDQLINSFSGSILLTKLVIVVHDQSVYMIFIKILEQNKEYLRKAYFNRMLSTLVSCCSEHMLQTYYRRSHVRGIQLIEESAADNYEEFLTRRYPKIMLINLMSENRAERIVESICRSLTSADTSVLAPVLQKRESFSLLLLMASSTSVESISSICSRILISIEEQNKTARTDLEVELTYLNKILLARCSKK